MKFRATQVYDLVIPEYSYYVPVVKPFLYTLHGSMVI